MSWTDLLRSTARTGAAQARPRHGVALLPCAGRSAFAAVPGARSHRLDR